MRQLKQSRANRWGAIGLFCLLVLGTAGYMSITQGQMDSKKGMVSQEKEMVPEMRMDMAMEKTGSPSLEGQAPVMLTPKKQKLIGVRTSLVEKKQVGKVIRTVGRVDYNETTLTTITTKVSGWIEELYIDYTGREVQKGEPLFSLYSPELVQTQEEYLLAKQTLNRVKDAPLHDTRRGAMDLVEASRNRLLLWDITEQQVAELESRGRTIHAVPILSPVRGYVTEKMAIEGMYVKPGMALYQIADLSKIWVYADIYEDEIPYIKVGQKTTVNLSYLPGKTFKGKVVYIYPYLNNVSRTATVRLEFSNPRQRLKPGMYADVEIRTPMKEALVVPETAILDSGIRQIAFVAKGKGRFEPREVKIGPRINHDIVVLEGLAEGETVVTHGTFLIDSESKMMAAMEGMMGLIGMGDWKMEHSKMGEMEMGSMDMDVMNVDGKEMKEMPRIEMKKGPMEEMNDD